MRIAKLSRLANVALLLLAALEVQADEHLDVAEAADHAVEDMVAETTNETETIPLSLHETVNLAIQYNPGVEVSRQRAPTGEIPFARWKSMWSEERPKAQPRRKALTHRERMR